MRNKAKRGIVVVPDVVEVGDLVCYDNGDVHGGFVVTAKPPVHHRGIPSAVADMRDPDLKGEPFIYYLTRNGSPILFLGRATAEQRIRVGLNKPEDAVPEWAAFLRRR